MECAPLLEDENFMDLVYTLGIDQMLQREGDEYLNMMHITPTFDSVHTMEHVFGCLDGPEKKEEKRERTDEAYEGGGGKRRRRKVDYTED